jgi:hypothetical protein
MEDKLYTAYTGSEIEILLLKAELEEYGISGMVRDRHASGIVAGFYGGSPSSVELLLEESDRLKAEPLIAEFLANKRDELTGDGSL